MDAQICYLVPVFALLTAFARLLLVLASSDPLPMITVNHFDSLGGLWLWDLFFLFLLFFPLLLFSFLSNVLLTLL